MSSRVSIRELMVARDSIDIVLPVEGILYPGDPSTIYSLDTVTP